MLNRLLPAGSDLFTRAATALADVLQGGKAGLTPTPISRFKASYGEVLDGANQGRPQVIMQGRKRYLLLSEDQVIALAQHNQRSASLGETVRSIAAPAQPMAAPSLQRRRAAGAQFRLPAPHAGR